MAAPGEDLGHVTIGAREIYDEVRATREEVRASAQSLQAVTEALADHESRLRAVERWKYSLPAALVVSLISAATAVLTK